jgi:hypothetical protein
MPSLADALDWLRVVKAIRVEGLANPLVSRHFGELYVFALEAAPKMLASFRQIDDAAKVDIAVEVVTGKARSLVEADTPYGYFRVALRNRATDVLRADVRIEREPREGLAGGFEAARIPNVETLIDERRALDACSDRDRDILIALGLGETPRDVARLYRMTPDSVYQILSRFRRRHGR